MQEVTSKIQTVSSPAVRVNTLLNQRGLKHATKIFPHQQQVLQATTKKLFLSEKCDNYSCHTTRVLGNEAL